MRSKLLRAIFPDRDAIPYNHQIHLPVPGLEETLNNPVAQAFSQIVPQAPGLSAGNIGSFLTGAGNSSSSSETIIQTASHNLDRLRLVTETQITETHANTTALTSNTTAKSITEAVSSVNKATGGLLSGFTSLPLVSGLLQLFGGGPNGKQAQALLPKYTPPPAALFDTSIQSGSDGAVIQQAGYDRFGNPRQTLFSRSLPFLITPH